ncbi:MAG: RNA methyltransferase [Chlamydiota bacterium]|nr:RNA methyltransferase [Chlamydiota bacterium]
MSRRKKISIILVEPQSSGNIGSVARVMMNMNFKQLLLVSPRCSHTNNEAFKMAIDGKSILENIEIYPTLLEALKDYHLAVGTTRRKRKRLYPIWSPQQIASNISTYPYGSNVAIVFGREDRGLTNEELSMCQMYATIPSSAHFPSLNLSHAVLVFLYELYVGVNPPPENHQKMSAQTDQLEAMYTQLKEMLLDIDFINRGDPNHMMQSIRNIFGRSRLTPREIRIIRGICSTMQFVSRQKKH